LRSAVRFGDMKASRLLLASSRDSRTKPSMSLAVTAPSSRTATSLLFPVSRKSSPPRRTHAQAEGQHVAHVLPQGVHAHRVGVPHVDDAHRRLGHRDFLNFQNLKHDGLLVLAWHWRVSTGT
jgi:hypothetical protein